MARGFVTEEQGSKLRHLAEQLEARGLRQESQALGALLGELDVVPEWVGTAEAAEILLVTQQTVRNWVRAGVLPGRRDPTGHVHVARDALLPALRQRDASPTRAAVAISDDEVDVEIAAFRAERRETRSRPA